MDSSHRQCLALGAIDDPGFFAKGEVGADTGLTLARLGAEEAEGIFVSAFQQGLN